MSSASRLQRLLLWFEAWRFAVFALEAAVVAACVALANGNTSCPVYGKGFDPLVAAVTVACVLRTGAVMSVLLRKAAATDPRYPLVGLSTTGCNLALVVTALNIRADCAGYLVPVFPLLACSTLAGRAHAVLERREALPGREGGGGSSRAADLDSQATKARSFAYRAEMPLADHSAQCQICLAEYAAGDDLCELTCCHCFHELCIDRWMRGSGDRGIQQRGCPMRCEGVGARVEPARLPSQIGAGTLQV